MFVMLGAGALASDIIDTYPNAPCVGYFIEPNFDSSAKSHGKPIYRDLNELPTDRYFIGVGDKDVRSRMIQLALDAELRPYDSLISEARYVSSLASIAGGTGLGYGVIVERNAVIGPNCLFMHGAIIGHDATLGQNVVLAPSVIIGGAVTIGNTVFVGANAVIAPGVTIGSRSHISLGAAVLRDVPPDSTVVGNPGRVVRSISPKIS